MEDGGEWFTVVLYVVDCKKECEEGIEMWQEEDCAWKMAVSGLPLSSLL